MARLLVVAMIAPLGVCACTVSPTTASTNLSGLCSRNASDFSASTPQPENTVLVRQCDDLNHVYLTSCEHDYRFELKVQVI